MTTQGGRQRTNVPKYVGADEALNQISKEAEDRLAAKRAARAEAREIRHRELEKKKKEQEQMEGGGEGGESAAAAAPADGEKNDLLSTGISTMTSSSLLSQGDGIETFVPRDYRKEYKELNEKYKEAMTNIAQLDNEKVALGYTVDRLSEEREEREESHLEVQRQLQAKTSEVKLLKKDCEERDHQLAQLKEIIEYQTSLMQRSGLMVVHDDEGKLVLEPTSKISGPVSGSVLLSAETVSLLDGVEGSLDTKIKKTALEKTKQEDQIRKLQQQLEEFQQRTGDDLGAGQQTANGAFVESFEIEQAYRTIHEQKLQLQKSEQRIVFLEGTVARAEEQLKKYKKDAEEAEQALDVLRGDRRKLQRDLRDSQSIAEDLRSKNEHLTKRLEKIKQTRLALAASDSTLSADHEWLKAAEDTNPRS